MQIKQVLKDILGISVIASILGLAYNFYSEKTLPLIKQEQKVVTVSENELFSSPIIENNTTQQPVVSLNADTIKMKPQSSVKDTVKSIAKVNTGNIDIKFVNKKILKTYINDKRVVIIDARSPEMYSQGHIGASINIFPLTEEKDAYFQTISTLPRDKTFIIYCDGGNCDLSHHLFNDLKNFGFEKVFIYNGGWEDWTKNANS